MQESMHNRKDQQPDQQASDHPGAGAAIRIAQIIGSFGYFVWHLIEDETVRTENFCGDPPPPTPGDAETWGCESCQRTCRNANGI